MRWKSLSYERRQRRSAWIIARMEWHDWFAWRPVLIEGQTVWLETVQRRMLSDWWKYRIKPQIPPMWPE
jgi:hypothetical protein